MDRLLDIAMQRGAVVLGLGVSGRAAADYLLSQGVRPLYLMEEKPSDAMRELVLRGAIPLRELSGISFGLLVRSPGIPERHPAVILARERGAVVTNEIGLWFSGAEIPTLGVTGSDGKTTTANFLSGIMQSIPPMNEVFNMAGMKLPEYLGSEKKAEENAENN